jgi:hypothetical protein
MAKSRQQISKQVLQVGAGLDENDNGEKPDPAAPIRSGQWLKPLISAGPIAFLPHAAPRTGLQGEDQNSNVAIDNSLADVARRCCGAELLSRLASEKTSPYWLMENAPGCGNCMAS